MTSTLPTAAVPLESIDDIALAERLKRGHDSIITELHKLIVGQEDVIELVLLSLFTGGNSLIVGVHDLAGARSQVLAHPVHARPDAERHHRHGHHPG